MNVNKGDRSIVMPEYSTIHGVYSVVGNVRYRMNQMLLASLLEMRAQQQSIFALPIYFAPDDQNGTLEFWPDAPGDTQIVVRYAPPIVEL